MRRGFVAGRVVIGSSGNCAVFVFLSFYWPFCLLLFGVGWGLHVVFRSCYNEIFVLRQPLHFICKHKQDASLQDL
jgi:hypothetical protein